MRRLLHTGWIGIALLIILAADSSAAKTVHVISIDASINPATADFIETSIEQATQDGAECIVIRLNTPGGLLKSTRVIVSSILEAKIPVVIYVAPSGAQSASAGVFITMAAHVAAMAPGTNIGAAHPVGMQGQQDSIMMEKATNDAAAFIRSISEKRSRNIEWAEDAVRKSLSITEGEALEKNVIDLVAENVEELLQAIDGREVEMDGTTRILQTADVEIVEVEMSFRHELLDILSDPNVAYIFFLLGIYGLMFELYNPGNIFPGAVGVICLILAFYSLHTLPINYAGLALIIVGIILLLLEIKITSYGLLSIGGAVCLLLGSIMLISSESYLEFVSISWGVIIPAVLFTVLFFVFAISMGIRAQRRRPTTGLEGIVGEVGKVMSTLNPDGQVKVRGEIWTASSSGGKLKKGTRVVVLRAEGLHVTVEKADTE
jgi:membrane-bound serine protease (ClpP class)